MTFPFKVACAQNCAGPSVDDNLDDAAELVREAHGRGANLVCLPEYFSCLHVDERGFDVGPMAEAEHPALPRMRALARELGIWIQPGSLAIRAGADKIRNRAYLIDPQGDIAASYDKIHLFDVDLANGESYRESDTIEPGDRAVVVPGPSASIGLSICYDLRFAALYRALAQAGSALLTVPAAFTRTTGEAHWHALLRSRAIETGSYVVAACQYGHHGSAESYGHSLIVDPWGEVLVDGGTERCVVLADVDPANVARARKMIPALEHDRAFRVQAVSPKLREAS